MNQMLNSIDSGPHAWRGRDLAGSVDWQFELGAPELDAIEHALTIATGQGSGFPNMRVASDFPLPTMAELIRRWSNELENGRGFLLLRGLPVSKYSESEIRTIYYGLGLNIGQPVRQNPAGDLLGLVMNVGDPNDKQTRVYETNRYLPYHSDPSDVVGLLCLRRAVSGGLSSLVSSATVHNQILTECAQHLPVYYQQLYYAHLGDDLTSPIFSYHQGKLACRYLRQYIELGYEMAGKSLTDEQIAALDFFDRTMSDEDNRLDMMLEPGDLQFANNYMVMHSRTEFRDHDEPSQHRKMLRLWLKMSNARELAPQFPGRNGFGAPL